MVAAKNNRAPFLYYVKFCASFQSHWLIQTGVTVQKRSIWVKIGIVQSCMTLKFDVWPWKTIRHLCYVTLSFMHHFKAITGFKLELRSGNAQFGLELTFFEPCDLVIWQMILKGYRAPLLSHIKHCASFHYHMWIQTGVTVWKLLNWVLTSVTLTSDLYLNLHGPHFCHWQSLPKISWRYNDGNIVKRVWQAERQTDRQTDGLNHS